MTAPALPPRKLTPEVREKLLAAARKGRPHRFAAECSGIHRNTLSNWLEQGRREWEAYQKKGGDWTALAAFASDYDAAQAEYVATLEDRIEDAAAQGEWQAAAWKLERKWQEIYSKSVLELNELKARLQALLAEKEGKKGPARK